MLDATNIIKLYDNVIASDIARYYLTERSIKYSIECMAEVYKPKHNKLNVERSVVADYTDPAHRCAYLHKYAAFHTIMVRDMLYAAIQENFEFFYQLVFTGEPFRICSLGGGPGTDIVGALAALHTSFSFFETSATVIDYMVDWSYSFGSILRELGTGFYGAFGNNVSSFLNWRYVGANLLKTFSSETLEALSSASLVTMVKFASAAACQDTKSMIKNIFAAMKPGAALLFIDNDGGGFHTIMMEAAIEFNFSPIYGPLRREVYENSLMKIKRFGYTSCCKSTLTVHLLQKPFEPFPSISHEHPRHLLPLPWKTEFSMDQRPSLLGSPLTPMLFSMDQRPSLLGSPLTPMLYRPENHPPPDYQDIVHSHPVYSSPVEIPHMLPRSPMYSPCPIGMTPDPRHNRRGCIPLRLKKFRHHISQKLQNVKSHAKKMFKKKNKKPHPIFQL